MDVAGVVAHHRPLLAEFAGTSTRDVADTFWNQLLSFPVPLMRLPPSELETATTTYFEQLGTVLVLNFAIDCDANQFILCA